MTDVAAPQPIVPPDNFPTAWEQPDDASRFWERELMHVPGQCTAMDYALMRRWVDVGFNRAVEDYSMPIRNTYRRLNTYLYQSIAPVSHDPAVLESLGRMAQERLMAVLGRQTEIWARESLPEIQDLLHRWRSFDLARASDEQLVTHFQDTIAWSERAWHIHFRTVMPMILAMSLFDDLYKDLLGSSDPYGAMRLIQGFDNLSLRVDRELYALSRRAHASPDVLGVLETATSDEVPARLRTTEAGRAFLADLDGLLAEHGRRATLYISVSAPSWIEDPSPLIRMLQDAATQPEHDPLAELQRVAGERESLTATARGQVSKLPAAVRGQFEGLLEAARQAVVLQEDHNYWIDGQVTYEVRRVLLELGARLARNGAVDSADDVFHLVLDEVRDLSSDRRAAVTARRAELDRFRDVPAPPVLGALPPGPPPDDPITRAVFKMFGGVRPEKPVPGVLLGMAGSPGVARGRVRVVRSLRDGDRLQHGEVLVAPTTAPPWTPLFSRAAAIVTDTGGILSHCAIVAREYEIPAVVGAKGATDKLRDGQMVEVDGGSGSVRVIES